jgi:DNA-binding winged helix-turn-helix (wHTH) protein
MEHKSFVFRFEDIEVRENEYALTRAGETVNVEPTAFRVLLYLLRHAGRLVTKDEIMAEVWHDRAVSDNSLTRCIAVLRRLLDDSSRDPRLIATVQTVGYRFLVPVEKWSMDATPESAPVGVEAGALKAGPNQNKPENAPPPAVAPPQNTVLRSAPRWLIPAAAGLLLALVLAGLFLTINRRTHSQAGKPNPSFEKWPNAVVTLPGLVSFPALSPDGKQIAFTWMSEAQPRDDLFVQLIGSDQPLRLTHNTSGFICCAAWSPDDRQIAYGHCDDNGGSVVVAPALGGTERKLTEVVCRLATQDSRSGQKTENLS